MTGVAAFNHITAGAEPLITDFSSLGFNYGLIPSFIVPTHRGMLKVRGQEQPLSYFLTVEAAERGFTSEEIVKAFLDRTRKSLSPYWLLTINIPEKTGMRRFLSPEDLKALNRLTSTFSIPLAQLTLLAVKSTLQKPLATVLPLLARIERAAYMAGAETYSILEAPGGVEAADPKMELGPEQVYRAAELLSQDWVLMMRPSDIRLHGLNLERPPASWIQDIVNRESPHVPVRFVEMVARLESIAEMTFPQEVASILEAIAEFNAKPKFTQNGTRISGTKGRALRLAKMRYLYPEGGAPSLDDLTCEIPVSRERVRQLLRPFETTLKDCAERAENPISSPALDRLLQKLSSLAPCSLKDAQAELTRSYDQPVNLACAINFALLIGKPVGFTLEQIETKPICLGSPLIDCYLLPKERPGVEPLVKVLSQELRWCGATSLIRIAGALALAGSPVPARGELIATLQAMDGFRWLDEKLGWLTAGDTSSTAFAVRIRKLLEVAKQPQEGADIREAVSRDDTLPFQPEGASFPPDPVLIELVAGWPWAQRVQSRGVALIPKFKASSVLNKYEKALVLLFQQKGTTTCTTYEMTRVLKEVGFESYTTVAAWLARSPVLCRTGNGTYMLAGGSNV